VPPLSAIVPILAVAALAVAVQAQQVRAEAPVGAIARPGAVADAPDDPGVPVEMFENGNLDRYLRRAKQFLEREDFTQAIAVLQDVIEGRTNEVVVAGDAADATPPTAVAPPKVPDPAQPVPGNRQAPVPVRKAHDLDARNSVFSQDGRLYRPVRRLCHEMLAALPNTGLEIYRATHEVAAEELLQQALADGSLQGLERVGNHYFVTLPAGRAMALLADRLMHEGRYRAAVLVLRDLLDVYPATLRARVGIDEAWCRFKIALCLALAGEAEPAREAVVALAGRHPEASLRLLGELHAVKDLPGDEVFARHVAAIPGTTTAGPSCVGDAEDPLLPLWQFRFRNPDPYKDPKPANNDRNVIFFDGGVTSAVMPFAGRYGPATWVTFAPAADGAQRALFLEHYRLRVTEATSGLLVAQGDGTDEPAAARENHPRVRIAAVDHAMLRPVDDGERRYVLLGHPRASTNSIEPLRASELVAHDVASDQIAWRSSQWRDGDGGLIDVTFLAAPTVFGERLLLPALRAGHYSLECLDRRTGRPLWNAMLHAGGSPFFKAPGCPVVVQGGVAFVASNAGCVAAIDAFTGELRWIRRYERQDPLRKPGRVKRPRAQDELMGMGYQGQFLQQELSGFWPNDLALHRGIVIVAACDTDMLLGLDGATGDPVWMLDASTRYAPYGRLRTVVGIAGDRLFALSDTHLVAIGASGGLVEWARELPTWNGLKNAGRGRGALAAESVLVPGDREVIVFGFDGTMLARLPLPAFDPSREPMGGAMNLVAAGPWLAVGRAGGIEVFSSAKALRALAGATTDVRRKADLLARAGAVDDAIAALAAAIRASEGGAAREVLGSDLLGLLRTRAWANASPGDAAAGLRLLDEHAELLRGPECRLAWHLARVELCSEKGDLRAHEREQNRLYDFMEGKG